jgi:hypothetical protein
VVVASLDAPRPMSLLSPWMLLGLAAIAVPIAVHLVDRTPREGAGFPSLMFLQRIDVPVRSRRRLRDRALLALRCAALALIALAFAGPYVPGADIAPVATTQRATLIALDRSYSMAYAERWDSAVAAARAALDEGGPGEPTALLLFDTGVELVTDAAALGDLLSAARPGPRGTDLGAALEAGGRWLDTQPAAERRLVLISDLQRSGLRRDARIAMPAGITLDVRPVDDAGGPNAAIVHVRLGPSGEAPGRARLDTQLRATGSTSVEETRVTLTVDERVVEQRTVALRPGEEAHLEFEVALPTARAVAARLELSPDALVADDVHHLVLAPARPVRILLVGNPRRAPASGEYLRRALELASEPPVALREIGADAVRGVDLEDFDVVVIDDIPLSEAWTSSLEVHASRGGSVLVIAGDGVRGTWPTDLLPGRLGRTLDDTGSALEQIPAQSEGLDLSGLSAARLWRRRALETGDGDHVLARAGGAALLAERELGEGRSMVLATTLAPTWSTLALEPGFVPLAHALLARLSSREPLPTSMTVGSFVDLARHARSAWAGAPIAARLAGGAPVTVETPSGAEIRVAPGRALAIDEPGIHEVHAGTDTLLVATNVDARESDLAALTPAALQARLERSESPGATAGGADTSGGPQPRGDRWWWRVLLAGTILLLIESWLANRLPRPGARPTHGGPPGDQPARSI